MWIKQLRFVNFWIDKENDCNVQHVQIYTQKTITNCNMFEHMLSKRLQLVTCSNMSQENHYNLWHAWIYAKKTITICDML